jgi:hypothetical protein
MKAYLIAGHGSEPPPATRPEEPSRVYDPTQPTPSRFVVPDGCTIIVHKQPYEWAEQHVYERAVRSLMNLPKEMLTHPSDHSDDIIDAIGSIAIYRSGDVCSNFSYTTQSCFTENNTCDGIFGSGVNNLIQMKDVFSRGASHSRYKGIAIDRLSLSSEYLRSFNSYDIAKIVAGMYRFSVYPTQDDITTYISKKQGWIHQDHVLKEITEKHGSYQGKIIEAVLHGIKQQPSVNPTQQELCHKFPGVYYNLVCRFTEGTYDINMNNNQLRKPQTRHNTLRYSNRNTRPKNVKNRMVRLLQARLQEAELHRKRHLKKFTKKQVSRAKEVLQQARNRRTLLQGYIENYDALVHDILQQGENVEVPDIQTIKNAVTDIDKEINTMKHLNTFVFPSNNTNSTYTPVTNKNGKVTWKLAANRVTNRANSTRKNE